MHLFIYNHLNTICKINIFQFLL
uniref:Uncharacterized protein n=1 Tax=Moumouvirus sp. 'Monve' TaxID=1128131 RepID=H2EFG5_9VIRU|nr:hypothetical protein mv_L1028 [Moumouvirus Monve]